MFMRESDGVYQFGGKKVSVKIEKDNTVRKGAVVYNREFNLGQKGGGMRRAASVVTSKGNIYLRVDARRGLRDGFFDGEETTLEKRVLLPSNPFTGAADYALAREGALRVFLEYADVPIDTNHLERALRPIPMGRKAWLFCWTEVGAEKSPCKVESGILT